MSARFRELLLSVAIVLAATDVCKAGPNPWENSMVGKCYPSMQAYLAETFGDDYIKDENIKVFSMFEHMRPADSFQYWWTADTTPENNWTRILFRVDGSGRSCAILLVPSSASISFEKNTGGSLPAEIISEEAVSTGWATKVVYRLKKDGSTYYPVGCQKVKQGSATRRVSCRHAFE